MKRYPASQSAIVDPSILLVSDRTQVRATLLDGFTQLVTDRVRAGWSCHTVTFLSSQLPGPPSAAIGRMKDEVHRVNSTFLTRVHRKPRMASTNELPVLIAVMDLPVHKHNESSGPMVLCNGGLHLHALVLIPPASRLRVSLANHLRVSIGLQIYCRPNDSPDQYFHALRSLYTTH
jgi:hypothetical protein